MRFLLSCALGAGLGASPSAAQTLRPAALPSPGAKVYPAPAVPALPSFPSPLASEAGALTALSMPPAALPDLPATPLSGLPLPGEDDPALMGAAPEDSGPRREGLSWDGWFDGRGRRSAPEPVDPPQGALRDLSLRWRTSAQIERLAVRPRARGEAFEFAVIGDAEPGRFWFSRFLFNFRKHGVFFRQLRRIQGLPADFVVQLGDMVSRGTARNFLRFLRDLASSGLGKPYLTVIGNHDRRKPHGMADSKIYQALFGPTDYHFDRGGYRFVVLDSSSGRLSPRQLDWLREALATDLRKIVFTHMPPYLLRAWTAYDPTNLGGFKVGAEEFARAVSEAKVERVYVGHIHGFGVTEHLGVRYVLTGGGGSPLFPSGVRQRFHHFLRVQAGPEGVSETVYKDDGEVFTPGPPELARLTGPTAGGPRHAGRAPRPRRRRNRSPH